jgi:hypothetical protein
VTPLNAQQRYQQSQLLVVAQPITHHPEILSDNKEQNDHSIFHVIGSILSGTTCICLCCPRYNIGIAIVDLFIVV